MYKKIVTAIFLSTALIALAGCQESENSDSQDTTVSEEQVLEESSEKSITRTSEESITGEAEKLITEISEEQVMETLNEQEAGEAQIQADTISEQHINDTIPETGVESAAFTQNILNLDESENWIRVFSEGSEDGSHREIYACDEKLKYTWSYIPSESVEVQSNLDSFSAEQGWLLHDFFENEELSKAINRETYHYTAYEDDAGYSMYHQGVYISEEGGYYIADFSMIEGDYGIYYETVENLLSQVYIEE